MYANTKYCKNVAFTNCLRAYQRHHNGNLIQNARFNSDFDIDSNSHCAKLTSDLFRSEILDLLEQAQEHPYFQGPRRQLFDMNMDMNMDGMQQGGMQLPGLPGGLPATEEMCLKQVKGMGSSPLPEGQSSPDGDDLPSLKQVFLKCLTPSLSSLPDDLHRALRQLSIFQGGR